MKDYTTDNPIFSDKISIVERSDLVDYRNKNVAAEQLLQNVLVLKRRLEQCLGKDPEHGDSQNLTATFESGDSGSADAWTDVGVIKSGEEHRSLFGKISTMVRNARYLYRLLGTIDISGMGNGTVTGAIQDLSEKKVNLADITQSAAVNVAGKKALDAVEKNAAQPGTMAYDIAQINWQFGRFIQQTQ